MSKTNEIRNDLQLPYGRKAPKEKVKWEVKKALILNELAVGTAYKNICKKYSELWGVTEATMKTYIREAVADMYSEDETAALIAINKARLDAITEDSLKDDDRKNAIKAIDIQNKMLGAYESKIKVTPTDDININLNF